MGQSKRKPVVVTINSDDLLLAHRCLEHALLTLFLLPISCPLLQRISFSWLRSNFLLNPLQRIIVARMSSFLSRKLQTQSHHYFQSLPRRTNVCPIKILARTGRMKVTSMKRYVVLNTYIQWMATEPIVSTEASRTRKHLKRAEVNDKSSDPIKSRTY